MANRGGKGLRDYRVNISDVAHWKKEMETESIVVVEVYSSTFGQCQCIGPTIQQIMLSIDNAPNLIKWLTVNVGKLEEDERALLQEQEKQRQERTASLARKHTMLSESTNLSNGANGSGSAAGSPEKKYPGLGMEEKKGSMINLNVSQSMDETSKVDDDDELAELKDGGTLLADSAAAARALEEVRVPKLEAYTGYSHPRPLWLLFSKGEMVAQQAGPNAPRMFRLIKHILEPENPEYFEKGATTSRKPHDEAPAEPTFAEEHQQREKEQADVLAVAAKEGVKPEEQKVYKHEIGARFIGAAIEGSLAITVGSASGTLSAAAGLPQDAALAGGLLVEPASDEEEKTPSVTATFTPTDAALTPATFTASLKALGQEQNFELVFKPAKPEGAEQKAAVALLARNVGYQQTAQFYLAVTLPEAQAPRWSVAVVEARAGPNAAFTRVARSEFDADRSVVIDKAISLEHYSSRTTDLKVTVYSFTNAEEKDAATKEQDSSKWPAAAIIAEGVSSVNAVLEGDAKKGTPVAVSKDGKPVDGVSAVFSLVKPVSAQAQAAAEEKKYAASPAPGAVGTKPALSPKAADAAKSPTAGAKKPDSPKKEEAKTEEAATKPEEAKQPEEQNKPEEAAKPEEVKAAEKPKPATEDDAFLLAELQVSAKDLPRDDIMSKSDPIAVLSLVDAQGKKTSVVVGKTEQIKDNQSPTFQNKLYFVYRQATGPADVHTVQLAAASNPLNFQTLSGTQWLVLSVYDVDSADKIEEDDLIGEGRVSVGELVHATAPVPLPLFFQNKKANDGKAIAGFNVRLFPIALAKDTANIKADTAAKALSADERAYLEGGQRNTEEAVASTVNITVGVRDVPKSDLLSKADPIAVLYVENADGKGWTTVGKTEMIKDNANPDFKTPLKFVYQHKSASSAGVLPTVSLPSLSAQQKLRFAIYDVDSDDTIEEDDLVGEVKLTVGEVVKGAGAAANLSLLDAKGQETKNKTKLVLTAQTGPFASARVSPAQFVAKALPQDEIKALSS